MTSGSRGVALGGPPNLSSFLKHIARMEYESLESAITTLISLLRHRQIRGSRSCAIATANLLLRVVALERWSTEEEILAHLRRVGRRLIDAQPRELAVGNIVRRVLGIVREEADDAANEENAEKTDALQQAPISSGMFRILASPAKPDEKRKKIQAYQFKPAVIEEVRGLVTEIQKVDDDIAAFASEHIHSNEIILTAGYSSTVQKFLIRAASVGKGPFTVLITEGYPNDHSRVHEVLAGDPHSTSSLSFDPTPIQFQRALTNAGITAILISDSAVFAMMSRVNKVILGTHAVTANGGLVAQAGTYAIAKAAKEHRTPVVIVSGVYKLSPVHPFDFEAIAEAGNPADAVSWEDANFVETVETVNVLYDYVPPELVDLYITNEGGHAPSYLYRVVADHYSQEDIDLREE